MKLNCLLVILLSAFSVALASKNDLYRGYKVYSVEVQDERTLDTLKWLSDNSEVLGLDFWSLHRVIGSTADIMVNPESQSLVESYLEQSNVKFGVKIEDLKEEFDGYDREAGFPRRLGRATSGSFDLTRFYRYEEIEDYLRSLAEKYPSEVTLTVAGRSFENRPIYEVKVGSEQNKKCIFIDAAIHAREWVTPATVCAFLGELLEVRNATQLLDSFCYIIVPVVNPDGYEHSLVNDRNWRKTRKPNGGTLNCVGTDGNRNYAYGWGGPGASSQPCSDTFRGTEAFSEPETRVVRDLLAKYRTRILFYLSFHSYGRYILYPWGDRKAVPENWEQIESVAQAGNSAAKAYNNATYAVGGSAEVLYEAAGGSDDYARGAEDIPIAITFECAGRGFTPPATDIHWIVAETLVALRAMVSRVRTLFP